MSLNEKSVMLAEALLEKGNDADMDEILPKIVDGLRYVKCYVTEYGVMSQSMVFLDNPVIIMRYLRLV